MQEIFDSMPDAMDVDFLPLLWPQAYAKKLMCFLEHRSWTQNRRCRNIRCIFVYFAFCVSFAGLSNTLPGLCCDHRHAHNARDGN